VVIIYVMRRIFDYLLLGVVVVFAFLASSFAVRNSDFWLHLASGRLLAEGRYHFGEDPFAFTTEGVYWANHAWLFDLLLYLGYVRLPQPVLVVLKALLIALLAVLLLRMRRRDSGWAWPAAGTLLAVLAITPRLLLHSTLLSYVLLALTLWLLWRPSRDAGTFGQQLRHYAPVLVIFALWVNVDAWFLLGPLMAALFWVGDWLAPAHGESEPPRRTPAWLAPAGLAACLLNPHHLKMSLLPAELLPLPAALRGDAAFEPMLASPWRMSLYYHPLTGLNLANSAYLALLVLGALSFLFNLRRLAGWRVLVWLTWAALSAWRVRLIPFFAVAAAPITVLNWQDALVAQWEMESKSRRIFFAVSRSILLLSGLTLIFLAWPGWLQGFQETGHHVDWTVRPDGSLRRVAEKLLRWRGDGKLSAQERGFLSHPSLVHYCAWFCPEEKGFLDSRLELFGGVANQYEEIRRAVHAGRGTDSAAARRQLASWGIPHLVLYDPELPRLEPALRQFAVKQGDWTLLDIDGLALIAGWRDGERMLPERVPFDSERLVFAPRTESADEALLPPVPRRGPSRGPRANDFWSHFGTAIAPTPWPADSAAVLLQYFDARAPRHQIQRMRDCSGWAAALPGLSAPGGDFVAGLTRLAVHFDRGPFAVADLRQQPPDLPLLAVRAARCAITVNPDDAAAYLRLGQAYFELAERTPEWVVLGALPPLAKIRHIQIAVALENALRCQPDSRVAHEAHCALAILYERGNFLDAALEHHRAALGLERRGAIASPDAAAAARQMEERESHVKLLERRVSELKNEFRLATRNLESDPTRKAQAAQGLGLPRLALEEVLMRTSPVLLGGEGIRLQVELQLMLGRSDILRERLQSSDWQTHKGNLGTVTLFAPPVSSLAVRYPAYDWLLLCQSAADGDYEQAESAAQALSDAYPRQWLKALPQLRKEAPSGVALELALSAAPSSWLAHSLAKMERRLLVEQLMRTSLVIRERGDLHLLRALLALECGDVEQAEQDFRESRRLGNLVSPVLPPDPGAALSNAYLSLFHSARRGRK
jgi:tetratricopeptide (TPR) repeat protein